MNKIWGKIIGAFFGLLLAGPLGALIGVIIGAQIDKQLANPLRGLGKGQRGPRSLAQQVFFETTFAVMGHVAKADGRVSQNEIRLAQEVMQSMQLDEVRRQEAIVFFNQGKEPSFNLDLHLQRLLEACHREPMLLKLFFEMQMRAASADGLKRAQQSRILHHIAAQLGIQWVDFDIFERIFTDFSGFQQQQQQRATYVRQPPLHEAYVVLGVNASSTDDDIKKAYRLLIKENHPDKLIAKGLPPEMIKLATEKTQRIQKAYDQIKQARGM